MIKKIQNYLLLHHPLIWNTRIIPMLLITTGLHLLFFGISYIVTDNHFDHYHYYSVISELGLLYFFSIVVGIILLISWLVFYNRNNGFKTFYPRKTSQLYLEWILIFIITTGIAFIPLSITKGYIVKWKKVATLSEAQEAHNILEKADILIPYKENCYKYRTNYHNPISIPEGTILNRNNIDFSLFTSHYLSQKGITVYDGYIGPSLFFYIDGYKYYDDYDNYNLKSKETSTSKLIKNWLKNGQKDSICAIMKNFKELQEKQNLKGGLTVEQWFARIYKPPFFPVNGSSVIVNYNIRGNQDYNYGRTYFYNNIDTNSILDSTIQNKSAYISSSEIKPYSSPYLPYDELHNGYSHILDVYNDYSDLKGITLFALSVSIAISFFVFSFRITKGKNWLTAFISTGVLLLLTALLAVVLNLCIDDRSMNALLILLLWVALFVALFIQILNKIEVKGSKGRSVIYINLFLWLIPCIIPLLYFSFSNLRENSDDEILTMFWLNIPIVIASMWYISSLIRKWKSIGDE